MERHCNVIVLDISENEVRTIDIPDHLSAQMSIVTDLATIGILDHF